jgi:hypothetical protein
MNNESRSHVQIAREDVSEPVFNVLCEMADRAKKYPPDFAMIIFASPAGKDMLFHSSCVGDANLLVYVLEYLAEEGAPEAFHQFLMQRAMNFMTNCMPSPSDEVH